MSVTLSIRRLGKIRDAEVELKPLMIFSGNSSLNKSYTSFLIYSFYKSIEDFNFLLPNTDNNNNIFQELRFDLEKDTIIKWTFAEFKSKLQESMVNKLRYLLDFPDLVVDFDILFSCSFDEIHIGYEKRIVEGEENIAIFAGEREFTLKKEQINLYLIRLISRLYVCTKLEIELRDTFFLPPSRAAVSKISALMLDYVGGMYKELIKCNEQLKFSPGNKELQTLQVNLLKPILGGEIESKNNESVFVTDSGDIIPISATASSIKELAQFYDILKKKSVSESHILFEEPEAHLHPKLQLQMANVIAKLMGLNAHMNITTHSDYFLGGINTALRLFKLKNSITEQEYFDFCEKNKFDQDAILDPNIVNSYYFKLNENNNVDIIKQDLEDGIPFDTFEAVVDEVINANCAFDEIM